MSRQINQPVASVKLTNVATVRLTVAGKRFEVACYKNKVLDYRAGLETDLTEVLQTSNIHIFTNVAKGQFAAASDLHHAFGETATQEEIAIQILNKGKSVQVSEGERTQLYESCLTQIATQIATNCIHPGTGKPYTVTQIKHALTQQHGPETTGGSKKKGKKHKDSSSQQQHSYFTVQPHKPIKQQYLQALKYLQASDILPIQRAAMELQWQYDSTLEPAVTAALQQLEITSASTTPQPPSAEDDNNTTGTTMCTTTRVFTVDPSVYRPLQELAVSTVPGSRLEILRQQVFQASTTTTAGISSRPKAKTLPENEELSNDKKKSEEDDDAAKEKEGSSSDSDDLTGMRKKNERKANKKQQKKAQRRMVKHQDSDSEDDDAQDVPAATKEEEAANAIPTTATTVAQNGETEKMFTCNTCVGGANSFATQSEYRAHFRSDWHRFNQKLKLQGASAVPLDEFEQCDSETFFATSLEY